jgi:hypothetical protein
MGQWIHLLATVPLYSNPNVVYGAGHWLDVEYLGGADDPWVRELVATGKAQEPIEADSPPSTLSAPAPPPAQGG